MDTESEMKNDHVIVDEMLSKLLESMENNPDVNLYSEIEKGLKRHIYVEEEVMFPRALKLGVEPARISGLEMEHASIWMLMDRIDRNINDAHNKKYINEIISILRAHNKQEEDYVYPAFGNDDSIKLEEYTVPENWVCVKLRK
ncbi:hemerythrin domain-containing protein [Picrophilus oshimae]|uniref:Hemerythrin HHE cation binding domain-containing protein n=1 Tax=Picrophilus torridus (strain ATCC 700027 / DSM 9790 / JCM 10055 / NBRC 100828 / KAW 2/3) TaxID=1122961 RepID=Q6L0U4_PICTO|nr:hemerythrin domain-containing protein [Picrophilus oshimae]AAT43408.1 hypothetical protein PTO0823 [Picrophilus oshimae DSM 9789]SMD30281.1 Hemerythrin HHE cation binding domain-containing protein [Picrophilus oshimae DSM 9789]